MRSGLKQTTSKQKKHSGRRLGYLSAAPRVSTRPEAELVGPKTHILGIIQAFDALGWEVKPFIVGDQVPTSWIIKGSEKRMRRSYFRILLADLTRILMGFLNARRAYRELGEHVDWVYERLAVFQTFGWIFKKNGKLWILETNAPLFIEAKNDRQSIILTPLARYLELKAYKDCDVLVCVSETLRDIIVEKTGISPRKVVVIPNGVDSNMFNPADHEPIRIFDGFTIGFVGNFASWQGIDILLEVVHSLHHDGYEIFLVLVGDGHKRKELEEKTKELGLSEYVAFVGFVSQDKVPQYIAGFDVGYSGQTVRTENRMYCSPIKVYEYMAMGKPAIASEYEDTRRVITDDAGFLFTIGDRKELKQKIIKAYQSKSDLEQMGYRARQVIVSNHSWKARISKLIDAIDKN